MRFYFLLGTVFVVLTACDSKTKRVLVGESETGKFSEKTTLKILTAKIIRGKSAACFKSVDTLAWGKTDEQRELEKAIMAGDFIFVSDKDSVFKKFSLKKN